MGSLRIIWMNCGLSLIHEPRVFQSLRTVKCTVSFIGKEGSRDKCRMFVNILINLVLLVFYHGVTAAIVTSQHHSY